VESLLSEAEVEVDLDDGEAEDRSAELRCRVDKFTEIVRDGANIRKVSAAQAREFLVKNIRPHLLTALLDPSASARESREEAERMIQDLQDNPDRKYSGLRSLVTSLSSDAVKSAALSLRDRQEQAILMERFSPGQSLLMQKLAFVEQQNLFDLHGRLSNANLSGLHLGISSKNINLPQAQRLLNQYLFSTQSTLSCVIGGFELSRECSEAKLGILDRQGTGLSFRASTPRYRDIQALELDRISIGRERAAGRNLRRGGERRAPIQALPGSTNFRPVQPGEPVRLNLR
jgi:hypothetical protein